MVISHQLFNYLILLKKQQHHDHLSLRNSSQQSEYEKFMKGFMSHIWATLKARSKKPFQNFDLQVLPEGNKDLIDYGPEGLENMLSHYGSNKTNLCKNELTC